MKEQYDDGIECEECHQIIFVSGEHPCDVCGRPTLHDEAIGEEQEPEEDE